LPGFLRRAGRGQRNCWPTLKAVSCYPICQVSGVPSAPARAVEIQSAIRSRFVVKSSRLKLQAVFANYVELVTCDDNRLQPVCKPFRPVRAGCHLAGSEILRPRKLRCGEPLPLRGAISQDRDIGVEPETDSFPDSA
jgi:hypothetical protein